MENDDLRQVLATKINNLLKVRGLNIEEASVESELEYSNFYYICKGKKMPRVDTLLKIAKGLNVPPEYFLRDMQIRLTKQRKNKGDLLLNKIIREIDKLNSSDRDFLFKTLKLRNKQK